MSNPEIKKIGEITEVLGESGIVYQNIQANEGALGSKVGKVIRVDPKQATIHYEEQYDKRYEE